MKVDKSSTLNVKTILADAAKYAIDKGGTALTRRCMKDIKTLVEAATNYAYALRRQHAASAKMRRAESSSWQLKEARASKNLDALNQAHGEACDALGVAEHELLVCAAVVGGWSRKSAKRSV